MLQPPEHQVAGHTAAAGGLGPLIDGAGLFYKPLQSSNRGAAELAFYTSFSADPRVPPSIRRFFPAFHGTQILPASDGSGYLPHLVLDDLFASLPHPSVIDLKIGSHTWPPSSAEDYIQKCLAKDRESTSLTLGFRVSGLQIRQFNNFYRPDRDAVRKFTTPDVRRVLRQFVSADPEVADCELVSAVYGGSDGVLAQLMELKAWFEDQTLFHFYSASVLLAYGEEGDGGVKAKVKLVDFAHAVEGDGVIDHNFLGGLCSLIKFVSEVTIDPEERGTVPGRI